MKFVIMFFKIEISKNRVKIEECYFLLNKKRKIVISILEEGIEMNRYSFISRQYYRDIYIYIYI